MNPKKFVIHLAIPLLIGALSGLITKNSFSSYSSLIRPPLSPPGFVFPIVWTILYVLMGISSYLISKSTSEQKPIALAVYFLQLLLNFLWSPVFFLSGNYLLSFLILVALWYSIFRMLLLFFSINATAAKLQIPYLFWCTYALYLNFGVLYLNN